MIREYARCRSRCVRVRERRAALAASVGVTAVLVAPISAHAEISSRHEIDFVTIGAAGNKGYQGPDPLGRMTGRGRVDYQYRIGRFETTTAEWMEFVNTFSVRGGTYSGFARPTFWGAVEDPTYTGPGVRWMLKPDLSTAAMSPVAGINWREAAMYCNWLHNNKDPGEWAISNGAYDTSTFFTRPDGTFADQTTHSPAARYWIPTWDEWLKAAHYDPNRYGPGQPGYWTWSNSSEVAPVEGPPGVGEANVGFHLPGFAEMDIPLGAYPGVTSPWGLLDLAGATGEWTEEWWFPNNPTERVADGSWAAGAVDPVDSFPWALSFRPNTAFSSVGLRVATLVPSPSVLCASALAFALISRRSRRRQS